MQINSFQNFGKRLAEVQAILDDLNTLRKTEWDDLTEEQQAEFVREIVMLRNMLRVTANRYFEW